MLSNISSFTMPQQSTTPAEILSITRDTGEPITVIAPDKPLTAPVGRVERKSTWSENYSPNFKKGVSTEVYALKRTEDILALQRYFIDHKQYRNYLYVALGINIGLRASDMTKLRWLDLLNTDGTFKGYEQTSTIEKKTSKIRHLVFNDDCKIAVRMYLQATGIIPNLMDSDDPDYWVFKKMVNNTHYSGAPYIDAKSWGAILKKAALKIGITYNVNTHSLRKTFGYRMWKNGVDIVVIQKIFQHSTPLITERYIGLTIEDINLAVNSLESVLARIDKGHDD